MKINEIKINSYGKLKNKKINLNKNINIIYGENESGKSTLLKFILNIFYGTSKNKKGKEISDFEKYKPWNSEEFSGKLSYELDNKNKYEIFREFNKKNPIIFNEKGEEITKEFNIDKNKGSEFFYEQTQINEEMFLATSVSLQQEVKISKNEQSMLVQKISNLLGTGEDKISYKKAIEKINKKQLEEVGTERSREKPINIIEKNIRENEEKINQLKKYQNIQYEIEEEKKEIKNKIKIEKIKNNLLKEIKKIKEKNNLENEKIKIKENIIKENKNKIQEIKNKIEKNEIKIEQENNNKKYEEEKNKIQNKNKKNKIIFIFLIIISLLWIIFSQKIIKNIFANYLILIILPIYFIAWKISKNKNNKKINKIEKNKNNIIKELNEEKNTLINEIKIIEKNSNDLLNEINKIKKENENIKILEKQKIINNYFYDMKKIELNSNQKNNNNYLFNSENNNLIFNFENSENNLKNIENKINLLLNSEKIENELNSSENIINNLKMEINKIELKKENIEPLLDELSNIEEKLYSQKEEYKNLQKINTSIELAKKILEKAYEKMKDSVSPIFTNKLSENISEITNKKYTNIYFGDEQGLTVELENGNYVPVERLSIGTIDQLYLSLRLAMLDEISNEKVPIILDEAFAYYDNERLENILKYLYTKFSDRQLIILSCTKREKEILEKQNIEFNFVELN